MNLSEKILEVLNHSEVECSLSDIKQLGKFEESDSTLSRVLKKLGESGQIEKVGQGKNTKYRIYALDQYFSVPFFKRTEQQYNPKFLDEYVPGETFFLTQKERENMLFINDGQSLNTDFLQNNKRLYEMLIVDLSYSSSYLEGNTYSYLDTEVLIKYNEEADGKNKEETAMILNHKKAFDFLLSMKNQEQVFSLRTLCQIHSLLLKDLLPENDLGVLRKTPVKIGGSSYTPLEDEVRLQDEIQIFFKKLLQIPDPFEQAFFSLIFLPYFQIFLDGNKRSSRLFCNVPLVVHGLIPFSFLTIDKKAFVKGLLAVYELNDVQYLKQVFLDSYFYTAERYFTA